MSLAGSKSTSIADTLEAGRKKLTGTYQTDLDFQKAIARNYKQAFDTILDEADALARQIERAKNDPSIRVSPSWLTRQERYLSLQTQIVRQLQGFNQDVTDLLDVQRRMASAHGIEGLRDEVISQVGLKGPIGDIGGFGAATWARIDQKAFNTAMILTGQNRSPLVQLLNNIEPDAVHAFQRAFLTGIATGKNPRRIAREFRSRFKGIVQGRAQLIARTEWHRAVRIARSEAFTESQVIRSWIWRAAQDRTTCGVCYLMHGTEHPTTETLPGHPGCRCVMVPKTYDWHELGLPGLPNTKPPIEPGASMFRRLSEAQQRKLIGPTRLEMFKSGQMKLKDMTYNKPNNIWGPMRTFKNLPPKSFPSPTSGSSAYAKISNAIQQHISIDFGSLPRSHAVYSVIADLTTKMKQAGVITRAQWDAVSTYQGGYYRQFNRWARGLPPKGGGTWDAQTVKGFQENLGHITDLIAAAPPTPHDMMVWRGMRTTTQPIRVGGSFVDNAPISTSTRDSTAEGFAGAGSGAGDDVAFLHILVPKGSKAVTADEVSAHGGMGEQEVLIMPGSRVHILRRIEDRKGISPYTSRPYSLPQYEAVVITPK